MMPLDDTRSVREMFVTEGPPRRPPHARDSKHSYWVVPLLSGKLLAREEIADCLPSLVSLPGGFYEYQPRMASRAVATVTRGRGTVSSWNAGCR